MTIRISEYDFGIGSGWGRITVRDDYTVGEVLTQYGIVSVYAQSDDRSSRITRLDFAHGGRAYVRTFHGVRYTPRGFVTKAKRFAADIVARTEV